MTVSVFFFRCRYSLSILFENDACFLSKVPMESKLPRDGSCRQLNHGLSSKLIQEILQLSIALKDVKHNAVWKTRKAANIKVT